MASATCRPPFSPVSLSSQPTIFSGAELETLLPLFRLQARVGTPGNSGLAVRNVRSVQNRTGPDPAKFPAAVFRARQHRRPAGTPQRPGAQRRFCVPPIHAPVDQRCGPEPLQQRRGPGDPQMRAGAGAAGTARNVRQVRSRPKSTAAARTTRDCWSSSTSVFRTAPREHWHTLMPARSAITAWSITATGSQAGARRPAIRR